MPEPPDSPAGTAGQVEDDAPAPAPERPVASRARRGRRRAWLLVIVATAFGAVLTGPYLLLDMDKSRVAVADEAQFAVLVAHIFGACIALILGALQFLPSIPRGGRIHRTIGRVYLLAGVLPAAIAAVPVALMSGRLLTAVGLTVPAILWVVTGVLAYRAARRHDHTSHRNWMLRNYALTFLAVTSRVLVPLLLLARLALTGGSGDSLRHDVPSLIPVGQVLGWVLNLLVVEIVIARRRARTLRALPT